MPPVRLALLAAVAMVMTACQQPAPEAEQATKAAPETAAVVPLTEDQAAAEAAAAVAATEGQPETPIAPPASDPQVATQPIGDAERAPAT